MIGAVTTGWEATRTSANAVRDIPALLASARNAAIVRMRDRASTAVISGIGVPEREAAFRW